MHFPTDINLLWDAVRKAVTLTAGLSHDCGLTLWRQSAFNLRQCKKLYRTVQKLKHSTSKNADKKAQKQNAIVADHEVYLQIARDLIDRVNGTLPLLPAGELQIVKLMETQRFVVHADRQMDQIRRRVVDGEYIPHAEKVFSLFQEHTEWVSKGKAGAPVELGLKVNVMEDHHGFILHHQVMEKQTGTPAADEQTALSIVRETRSRFPDFRACSFDKEYHSPGNQNTLRDLLEDVVLPKKGRCNKPSRPWKVHWNSST